MSLTAQKGKSINELYSICLKNNIPFVSYSLPQKTEINTFVQYSNHPEKISIKDSLATTSGFVFSPFVENEVFSTYIIQPELEIKGIRVKSEYIDMLEKITDFQGIEIRNQSSGHSTQEANYITSVEKIKQLIDSGRLDKLVLSRVLYKKLPADFKIGSFLRTLFSKYPSAFRYIIHIPEEGTWIGASPEPLLTIQDKEATIVSLAGTQRINGVPVTHIKWNHKELNEQYIVSEYIENTLKNKGISGYTAKGPVSFPAANIVHLQTQFTFPANLVQETVGSFISTLHPTPSISGMPKEVAISLIPGFEKYQRRYYTGFLGPINFNSQTHLFINLRCLRISDNKIALYAGAGITEGSIPENEWDETNQKLATMMSIL